MNVLDVLISDVALESLRACVVAGLFVFIYAHGTQSGHNLHEGWRWLTTGFGLLLFASVLDVSDNFPELNGFVIIGDTHVEAFLEKVVGYLGGFVLLYIGLRRWLPLAAAGERSLERAETTATQQRYRDLVDLSPDGVILHRQGKIIYANAAAASVAGVTSPDAMIGKSTMDFIHPDFRTQTLERLRALTEGGLSRLPLVRLKVMGRDGQVRDIEVASGITDFEGETAIQSVLRDVSERSRMEEALRESERELRTIFDNMAEFYYRADLEGRIVRASGAAIEVTGLNQKDTIGLRLADHYVEKDGREKFLKQLRESNGRVRNFEAQLVRPDGTKIWVSTNAQYVFDKDGNVAGVEGTVRDITDAVQAREVLQHMAMHDVLTGLGNRRSFEARLKESLPRARRAGVGGAVLYFDLDGFKIVNDTYGHELGDDVLRQVGRRLKTLARETDFAARIGGDEFCLILEGAQDTGAIARVAEKLVAALSEPYLVSGHTMNIGVSIGIATFDGNENENALHCLVTQADRAMYQAKTSGGGTYRFADTTPSASDAVN